MIGSRDQSSDQNDLPSLFRTLRDESMFVRMAAAAALRAVGEPAVPGLIAELTGSERDFVRASAARVLGDMTIESADTAAEAIEALVAALADEDSVTRWYAAGALASLGKGHAAHMAHAVRPLADLLAEDFQPSQAETRTIAEQAAAALRVIDSAEARSILDAWWETQGDAF